MTLAELQSKGLSVQEIADAIGIPSGSVQKQLRTDGLSALSAAERKKAKHAAKQSELAIRETQCLPLAR